MNQLISIYCDESCHLEHDAHRVMVLGAVWCPQDKVRETADLLRAVKRRHGMKPGFETKWTKVSPAKVQFYLDVVDCFLDSPNLHFRACVITDKNALRHAAFGQDHDTWYYKMMFTLLSPLLDPTNRYRIYLDVKDTRGAAKIRKLHEVLGNNLYDFDRRIVERVQIVASHEVEAMQVADLLIGAVGYANRGLSTNAAKVALVGRLRTRSGYSLRQTTLLREEKLNIFVWQPQGGEA